jgi:hypothetical protein
MNQPPIFDIETSLQEASANLTYPPTPDIAGQVRSRLAGQPSPHGTRLRRLAWGAALTVFLLAGLLAVPGVRAQVLEFLQIGVVRIFLVAPTPTPTSLPLTATSSSANLLPGLPTPSPTPLSTSSPTATPSFDLAGEISLEQAARQAGFPILLPAYPPDLGLPDRVFLQDLEGNVLVLVWFDPADPGKVRFSMQQFSDQDNISVTKMQPVTVLETTVAGNPAAWTEGPYLLRFQDGDIDITRLIEGHVLIWEQGGITYRLETDLSPEEAVRIAESLQPWP